MSEQPLLTPSQQHDTERRIIHSAQLLLGGAVIDAKGILRPTGDQMVELETQDPVGKANGDTLPASLPHAETPSDTLSDSPTTEHEATTTERVREIVGNSIYAGWARNVTNQNGQECIMYGRGAQVVKELTHWDPFAKVYKPFEDAGVSELLTIAQPDVFDVTRGQRDIPDDQSRYDALSEVSTARFGDEAALIVEYTVISGGRYGFTDNHGRATGLEIVAIMKESDAWELMNAIQTDPSVARKMSDLMLTNPDALNDATRRGSAPTFYWGNNRPPYQEWREQNGGFERLALRTSSEQGPDQAQIIQF